MLGEALAGKSGQRGRVTCGGVLAGRMSALAHTPCGPLAPDHHGGYGYGGGYYGPPPMDQTTYVVGGAPFLPGGLGLL